MLLARGSEEARIRVEAPEVEGRFRVMMVSERVVRW